MTSRLVSQCVTATTIGSCLQPWCRMCLLYACTGQEYETRLSKTLLTKFGINKERVEAQAHAFKTTESCVIKPGCGVPASFVVSLLNTWLLIGLLCPNHIFPKSVRPSQHTCLKEVHSDFLSLSALPHCVSWSPSQATHSKSSNERAKHIPSWQQG
eukprot:1138301-Pelagomonas_calceolata.AAC.3